MNNYYKNYGIWLGGFLLLLIILPYVGVYLPYPFMKWVGIIAGTVVATVMTHKAEGHNIQFGKAVVPVILILLFFFFLNIILFIINWGTFDFGFMLPIMLTNVFTELVIGISILLATGGWYMFEKAGKPGWAFIIPIYNLIVMCEIAKKPVWWVALMLLPIANIVILIMIFHGISTSFGKTAGFTVGMVFFRQIFFAILGYGDAQYISDASTPPEHADIIDN